MPAAKPPEFRRRALELVASGEPVVQVARNLGISESCLRRWMAQDAVDSGQAEGLTSAEKRELVELRRKNRGKRDGSRDPEAGQRLLREGERAPKIGFRLVHELAADGFPVAVTCRMLKVSRSGYYEWRDRPPSKREAADRELLPVIRQVHYESRGTYGAPRLLAELRLGQGRHVSRREVVRLMRTAGIAGISHRRKRGKARPLPAPHAGERTTARRTV